MTQIAYLRFPKAHLAPRHPLVSTVWAEIYDIS